MKTGNSIWVAPMVLTIMCASGQVFAVPGTGGAGRFTYKQGMEWKMRETVVLAPSQAGGMAPVTETVTACKVEKVFSDGAALVLRTTLSCRRGESTGKLAAEPVHDIQKRGYLLCARDGRLFLVQEKAVFDSPEVEAALAEDGNIDEVALLKSSRTTEKFLKVMRNQAHLDRYRVPSRPLKVGGKARIDGYVVVRQKDEVLGGVTCEVYKAGLSPMGETVWFDPKGGRLVKRVMTQEGNPPAMEATLELVE